MSSLYVHVKDDLLEKISTGVYPEGTIIPTENELADIYEVSRPTIRQAVQLLVDDGYLEKRKRRGTIVVDRKIQQEFTQTISSFEREMEDKGLVTKTRVVNFTKEKPNEKIKNKLKLKDDELVYKLVRLRYVGDEPDVMLTTFVPVRLFPHMFEIDFSTNSLYNYFDSCNESVVKIRRKLEVLKADDTVADLLSIKIDDPIFYFKSTAFNKDNEIIEYSIAKYRGDLNSFIFEIVNKK